MKKIILDTNFLLAGFQFKLDVIEKMRQALSFGYELFVLDKAKEEIGWIQKKQKSKHREAAKWALKIIEKNKLTELPTRENVLVDDLLVEYAKKGYIVATQDMELKRTLRKEHCTILTIRQKKYVMIENEKIV